MAPAWRVSQGAQGHSRMHMALPPPSLMRPPPCAATNATDPSWCVPSALQRLRSCMPACFSATLQRLMAQDANKPRPLSLCCLLCWDLRKMPPTFCSFCSISWSPAPMPPRCVRNAATSSVLDASEYSSSSDAAFCTLCTAAKRGLWEHESFKSVLSWFCHRELEGFSTALASIQQYSRGLGKYHAQRYQEASAS